MSDLKKQLKGAEEAELEFICDNFLGKAVHLWTTGQLSNFDYILLLNHLSGRTFANPNHYPVMPWIRDFTSQNGGWRDFTKSKYRLNKGDTQLDLTYESVKDLEAHMDPLSLEFVIEIELFHLNKIYVSTSAHFIRDQKPSDQNWCLKVVLFNNRNGKTANFGQLGIWFLVPLEEMKLKMIIF